MAQAHGGGRREHGQIMILFVLVVVVIMGLAALVIDVGVLRNANQNLWNALDAGALAGASVLPDDPSKAGTLALQYADKNYPGGLPSNVAVSFRCTVGSTGSAHRASDIPAVCDPGGNAAWTCNSTICSTACFPAEGDTCNTVVLGSEVTTSYLFGPAIGVESGTAQVTSAACKGACGAKPSGPVDLVVIVDRTPSMEDIDVANARSASHAVRQTYDPEDQWIGFGLLGPSEGSGSCLTQPASTLGTANIPGDLRRWVPVALSGIGAPINESYTSSGSTLAQSITCMTKSPGSVATDLEDPIPMAAYELLNNGRPGVTKGIILMGDGQPNNSVDGGRFTPTYNYCAQANASATAAKNAGIEIFTIGFGLDGSDNLPCLDPSGPFQGKRATQLLASMASDNSVDNGCPGSSNDDGDHYFCVPKTEGASANLSKLFRQAANALAGGTRLIHLP
ncbi:MAG: VWA domain-containing protein [Chloroflexota bacterium]|nr:VWA domain-containing protein [Chloroflexota bacterium]